MKSAKQKLGKLTTLILSLFLIIASCSKDDEPEKENDPTPDNPDGIVEDPTPPPVEDTSSFDPNLFTQSLILDNMRIIEGELPESDVSAKSSLIDFKIDSDTIFWAPGITKRIKIRSPQGTGLIGVWIYIAGSHSYIEADFRPDEASTDEEGNEISILYFDFDPTNWELPVSFPIRIIPLGPGGEPLGPTDPPPGGDVTGTAEKLHDHGSGNCDWTVKDNQYWRWQSLEDEAYGISAKSYKYTYTDGITWGGCDPNGLGPCDQGYIDDASIALYYQNFSYIGNVFFKLQSDGQYLVQERVYHGNLDICTSSFCGTPTANYSYHETFISGGGTWSIKPNCTLQLNPEDFDYDVDQDGIPTSPMIGGGEFVQFKRISDHFLEETLISSADFPDGLGTSVETYELTFGNTTDPLVQAVFWYNLWDETSNNSSRK